jgi:hypothetical protein
MSFESAINNQQSAILPFRLANRFTAELPQPDPEQ